VLLTFSQSAILGEQAYGLYGNQRSTQGTIGTDKGYTGQFHISLLFQPVFCLLFGWWSLRIAVPQYRKKYLVICEQGFLQVENTSLIKKVEVVRWLDIQSVKKSILGYVVTYRERENCSLDILYQNSSELAELT
jgi:hypothetical protein